MGVMGKWHFVQSGLLGMLLGTLCFWLLQLPCSKCLETSAAQRSAAQQGGCTQCQARLSLFPRT